MTPSTRHNCGFSLMEVLIALAIMSIALVSLLSVLATGLKAESQSTSRSDAQDQALQVLGRTLSGLEKLSATDATNFWLGDQSTTPWDSGQETRNRVTYHYEVYGENLEASGGGAASIGLNRNQLKKITVKVTWQDPGRGGDEESTLNITRLVNREV